MKDMKIYLVGGAVRDLLLKLPVTDKDWVVVNASTQEMLDLGFLPIGKDFPVFLHPKTHEQYALARTERKKGRGYTGFQCQASPNVTLEEDLMRRDLTMNAMAMTQDGVIIDPYHGQQDITQKILRHVSPAFIEDPVRILRVARFMARFANLGFSIAPETMVMMETMVNNGEVDALVADRVWQEMNQALATQLPAYFFDTLNHCGALVKLFPEFLDKIEAIHQIAFKPNNPKINFAKLALLLTRSAIKAFCQRYPVPVDYRELAILATVWQSDVRNFAETRQQISPESVLYLFEQADAFRRPDRFGELLMIFDNTDKLRQLFNQIKHCIPKKTLALLMQQGFTGKLLGEKIKLERLKKLKKHFAHF